MYDNRLQQLDIEELKIIRLLQSINDSRQRRENIEAMKTVFACTLFGLSLRVISLCFQGTKALRSSMLDIDDVERCAGSKTILYHKNSNRDILIDWQCSD